MTAVNICFNLQNRLIQTSPTGGQQYSDTSPFSIPCSDIYYVVTHKAGAKQELLFNKPASKHRIKTDEIFLVLV
jgi:hypothetical protein